MSAEDHARAAEGLLAQAARESERAAILAASTHLTDQNRAQGILDAVTGILLAAQVHATLAQIPDQNPDPWVGRRVIMLGADPKRNIPKLASDFLGTVLAYVGLPDGDPQKVKVDWDDLDDPLDHPTHELRVVLGG